MYDRVFKKGGCLMASSFTVTTASAAGISSLFILH